jgi:hypothetical protein
MTDAVRTQSGPGPVDPHPAAAHRHPARLAVVPHCRPVGVVAALGPTSRGDVLGEHGLEHLQGYHGCVL